MRILVNHSSQDKPYLNSLAYHLRNHGLTAVSTGHDLTIGELINKAKLASCEAILLCNEATLRYCVPGAAPTLDSYRGSRLNTSVPIVVCNKLDHLEKVPHGEWLLNKDLAKFKYCKKKPESFTYEVLTSIESFDNALSVLADSIVLAHDIETALLNEKVKEASGSLEGGDSIITCAAWTAIRLDGTYKTYVLPLVSFGVEHWKDAHSYELAISFLQRVNALSVPKVMHNGMYDTTHLIRYHAAPQNYTLDTMAFAHAEFSELPKSLDFVASYQLPDYIYWKDEASAASKKKDITQYWAYNAKDSWHTARILVQQLRTLPAYAKRNYRNKFKLVYPALYCNFEGFLLDQKKRSELRAASSTSLESSLTLLQTYLADPSFNPGSPKQVGTYLYEVLGAKKPNLGKKKVNKDGVRSALSCTDNKNLLAVSEQHPLLARVCTELLDYRKEQKAIGTYYDFKQMNGRLLYALNPFGTETERMACNSSSLWVGTQVQNFPSYAKAQLIADPGFELVEIDNSKSEAFCTAFCAKELEFIKALSNKDQDFYKTLGTLLFQIPYAEVTPFFRNKVLKKINHGASYMMGAKTFIENIGVKILYETASVLGLRIVPVVRVGRPEERTVSGFATDLLESYHKPFPRLREWYKEIFDEVRTTGRLVSPLGHTRLFFGKIERSHDMLRGAVAHQPQNLSVEVLNIGFWKIYQELVTTSNGEFRLKAQVHDSIVAQYPIAKRDYYVGRMQELMRNPITIHGRVLTIPTEAKVGPSWKELEDWEATAKEELL